MDKAQNKENSRTGYPPF